MTRPRSASITSYAPDELEFWRLIATERKVLRFAAGDRGRATKARQRLYQLRALLEREPEQRNALDMLNKDLFELAKRALLKLQAEFTGTEVTAWLLIGEPASRGLLPELEAAGIKHEPPSLDKL